jgi:hypothetical protein
MRVITNTKQFELQMNNIVKYSMGFLDGVEKGKTVFLKNLGAGTIQALAAYVDVSAKGNPRALHHIYEWYQTGSPSARLFDLDYTVSNLGLSITSTFKQSRTIKEDSNEPFYNKASIMERGIPITITPKRSSVLVFEEGGNTIFTKNPVTVRNPGGDEVQGSFEKTVDEFILRYFKQSFLRASGIYDYIKKPVLYKKNIKAGSKLGKSKGIDTGFRWIANAKIGVE